MARDGERGRGDWKARLGSRNSGPYAEASGDDTGPVDIAAVRHDDALIDALSGDGPVETSSAEEHQLAMLLADWRAEITEPPMPEAPDLDEIVAAVNQEIGARQVRVGAQSNGTLRLLRPILGAAAAVALVIGGMTAFSYNAEPGDPLWRVKEVVFSEQAQTTVAARADNDLSEASTLLEQNPAQAKARLEQARANVDQVSDPAKHDELVTQFDQLIIELRKVAPELADQLEATTPPSPAESSSESPRPTSGSESRPSTPTTTPDNTILQLPVDPSDSATTPSKPPTSDDNEPPVVTPTLPPVTTTPADQPPTHHEPTTTVHPSTISQSTVAETPESPSVPTHEGSSSPTFGADSSGR
ncbi:anti-sigma-D factor RsdA [Nocardia callitridis]|uniref:Anti-sigma-D factor RsdA n=1 Tax=Nocardia callitridis TaxID=648753 RepID=A0ABP9KXJ4_9NOCA